MSRTRFARDWAALFLMLSLPKAGLAAEAVRVIPGQQTVYVGETFPLQIRVSGHDSPEPPDLSALDDFEVQPLGGQNFHSSSMTTINGRSNRTQDHGYVFSYNLMPKRSGRLSIPPLTIMAGGKSLSSQPVLITAQEPAETDDFKLRLFLSKTNCYAGEPVLLEVIAYHAKPVHGVSFRLPSSTNQSFLLLDSYPGTRPAQARQVLVDGAGQLAEESEGILSGKRFNTVRFQKVLIPRQEGSILADPAAATFEMPIPDPRMTLPGSNLPMPNRFTPRLPHLGLPGSTKKIIVPSNPLSLSVQPLPKAGRPPNFAGPVGQFEISVEAQPVEVNVGDPIALQIRISGEPGLNHVELPPLHQQAALTNDFKVPADKASGQLSGGEKLFQLTIRPRRAEVTEIPPIELPYFDPATQLYRIARSKPIPLAVKPTKIIASPDLDGRWAGGSSMGNSPGTNSFLESLNLVWPGLFESRAKFWLLGAALLLGILWILHSLIRRYRQKMSSLPSAEFMQAYAQLEEALQILSQKGPGAEPEMVLQAMQCYLGGKLEMVPGAVTFADLTEPLQTLGVQAKTLIHLQEIFESCHACRFGGSDAPSNPELLINRCRQAASEIEEALSLTSAGRQW